MTIKKIVITGGPCAGKSSALPEICRTFSEKGYHVIEIKEGATELMTWGISPESCGSVDEFETRLIGYQIGQEEAAQKHAESLNSDKILIICDRGTIDCKSYMSEGGFLKALWKTGKNEVELRDSYDAVFHMESAAKGAAIHYSLDGNNSRSETRDEAAAVDERLLECWIGHPHLRVIESREDFNEKIAALIEEIAFFLGEPEPLEIERKFLIEYPDIAGMENEPLCHMTEITQVYLKDDEGGFRVRRRGEQGSYLYFLTRKKKISNMTRIETEERITADEYRKLINQSEEPHRVISKKRYCHLYKNRYFEIDIFPFWKDKALMEVELKNENEKVELPPLYKVIREVTGEKEYTNKSLAEMLINAKE